MTIFTVIRQQILMPLRAFLRILWVAHLMSDLGTESTFIARTENSGVVHSIQATARCLVRALDALLGFGIDNTERNWVEVRTHAVHAEPDQSNFRKSLFHNRRALTTGEASYGFTAALVKRDLPARAEVLQIRVDLRTYDHGRRPDSALDCASLLDRENTTAMNMTGRSVFSGLHEYYLV